MNKIITIILLLIFIPSLLLAQQKEILTNQSVISLVESGISNDIINAKIIASEVSFDLSVESLLNLKDKNTPSEVIIVMQRRQAEIETQMHNKIISEGKVIKVSDQQASNKNIPKGIYTFTAGMTFSKLSISGKYSSLMNDVYDIKRNVGYIAGFKIQNKFMRNKPLYSSIGIVFLKKGASFNSNYNNIKFKLNFNYLQIPIKLNYRVDLGRNITLIPSVGLYYELGLVASISGDNLGPLSSFSDRNLFENDGVKRMDMGANLGLGVTFGTFGINIAYEFGFLNIMDDDSTTRNGSFILTAEFNIFSKNKITSEK